MSIDLHFKKSNVQLTIRQPDYHIYLLLYLISCGIFFLVEIYEENLPHTDKSLEEVGVCYSLSR